MLDDHDEDVARVLAALLEAKAWFRYGLSDERLGELTGLSPDRVVAARRHLALEGLIERHGMGTESPLTALTPQGVAKAQTLQVMLEPSE
jgi:hypothetical protein